MGGAALAFAAAQHVPGLRAAVPLYGTPHREMPWIDITQIRIPVSYHTGVLDPIRGFSDPHTAVIVERVMKSAGCSIELHLYDSTPHSFLNAVTAEGVLFLQKWKYGVPPPDQLWLCVDRIVYFFKLHLGSLE